MFKSSQIKAAQSNSIIPFDKKKVHGKCSFVLGILKSNFKHLSFIAVEKITIRLIKFYFHESPERYRQTNIIKK